MAGTLYGISTGPGDPELLTLRAVYILHQCRVIAAPQKQDGESLALRIAGSAVDLSDKHILPLSFPMTRDENQLAENDRLITA
ncbi:MAG: precorrin-2 C(20)-methyltransferase, partial [Oscillospiraceae bacterium]|nr:precorrin-2 C(20)-methyltransferase [Oscillospiraceae bacterium]